VIPSSTPSPPPTIGPPILQEIDQFELTELGVDASAIAIDSRGDLYIGSWGFGGRGEDGIYKYAPDGRFLGYIRSSVPEDEELGIKDVGVSGSGNIYAIVDRGDVGIVVWAPDGSLVKQIPYPRGVSSFPKRMIVDGSGNIYLFDLDEVSLLNPDGSLLGRWEMRQATDPQPTLSSTGRICWQRHYRTLWCMTLTEAPHEFGPEIGYAGLIFSTSSGGFGIVQVRGNELSLVGPNGQMVYQGPLDGQLRNAEDVVADSKDRVYALYGARVEVYQLNVP
jgi:hypothetical protein